MDMTTLEWDTDKDASERATELHAEVKRLRGEIARLLQQRPTALGGPGDTRNLEQKSMEWDILVMQVAARGFDHPFKLLEAYDQIMGVTIFADQVSSQGDRASLAVATGVSV